MSYPQFHETRMGRQYYEVTLPQLAKELERLNNALERLVERLAALSTHPTEPPKPPDRS